MSFCKKILSILLVLTVIFSLAACGEKENDATVYFELIDCPENLDPQTASSDSELIIIRNIFEGLMRRDSKGETVEGACEKYEKNGLVYTFTLRDGLKWSDGSKLEARDFVFGIQRALDSRTAAPFASRLYAIKNAKAVSSGKAGVSSLGISASGNKVIIRLENDDAHFLEALTTSVAMPCKKSFFEETEGKYCLDANSVICNGSYDIYKWNKEDFGIRLYKNDEYNGAFKAKNGAVFFSCVEDRTQTDRLSEKEADMAFLPVGEIDAAKSEGLKLGSVENTCWFLCVGDQYDFATRSALLSAFSGSVYEAKLGSGMRVANSVYPEILNTSAADGVGMPVYDLQSAISILNPVIKHAEDEKFPNSTLYYYDKDEIKDTVTAILGHWQQNLCAFINIKPSDSLGTLQTELKTHSLQFAVFPVTAHSSSLSEYLYSLGLSGDAAGAQSNLLASKNIVPICFESTFVAYNSELSGVYTDIGNGYIDFAYIYKEE